MTPAGQLHIQLHQAGRHIGAVHISSSRPHHITRLLHGKSMPEVMSTLPLLYGVCSTAQRLAAWRAWQMAIGQRPAPEIAQAQQQLADLESLREHLLRIKIGWGGAEAGVWLNQTLGQLGQLQAQASGLLFIDGSAFAETPRLAAQSLDEALARLRQQLAEELFAHPPHEWLQLNSLQELEHWLQNTKNPATAWLQGLLNRDEAQLGSVSCPWLPELNLEQLHRHFSGPAAMEFIARPKWQGQCHETSALARQAGQPLLQAVMERHGAGLLARALARLLDLCCLLQPASQEGIDHGQLPEGIGIGQVESARGRLLHWLQYQDGLVLDYQVLAPTEWNCHPEGALAQGLINLGEAEAEILHHRAGMLIEAIDPCIGWHF